MLLMISMEKKLLENFTKTKCKKQIKKNRVEKVIKRKGDKLYVKWKVMTIRLIVGLIKKT